MYIKFHFTIFLFLLSVIMPTKFAYSDDGDYKKTSIIIIIILIDCCTLWNQINRMNDHAI